MDELDELATACAAKENPKGWATGIERSAAEEQWKSYLNAILAHNGLVLVRLGVIEDAGWKLD